MTCLWRHNEPFSVMTCFWRHDKPVDVMACFWCHGVCLTSWQTLWHHEKQNIMKTWFRYNNEIFDVSHHDVFLTSWQTFWHYDIFLISWQTSYIMTHVLLHDKLLNSRLTLRVFDVMMNLVISMTNLVTPLRVFFSFMINFLTSWRLFNVMPNFSQ